MRRDAAVGRAFRLDVIGRDQRGAGIKIDVRHFRIDDDGKPAGARERQQVRHRCARHHALLVIRNQDHLRRPGAHFDLRRDGAFNRGADLVIRFEIDARHLLIARRHDPHLGGAFAEVILEELAKKHAFGIVTTHYLNLKVMANKTPGIVNGAMAFDEKNLLPLYKLIIGKPGSSYTFSIAERIGMGSHLIERAKTMVAEDHFSLDKLLNRAEQDVRRLEQKEKELNKLLKENEKLKKDMEHTLQREKHQQQVELLKQQNKINEERIAYLKDMERKLKQIVFDWRRMESQEDKTVLMKQMHAMLFKQKEKQVKEKAKKKFDSRYIETGGEIKPGVKVRMTQNNQIGTVKEIRDKKAIVQLGVIPITVELKILIAVQEKETVNTGRKG